MSLLLITIESGESLETSKNLLREKSIHHLTVTRNNEVAGILSIKDLP